VRRLIISQAASSLAVSGTVSRNGAEVFIRDEAVIIRKAALNIVGDIYARQA